MMTYAVLSFRIRKAPAKAEAFLVSVLFIGIVRYGTRSVTPT